MPQGMRADARIFGLLIDFLVDFEATKLYCFVHKVPVCGECICYPEHQICVVRTYSEWVIDGEYDWPPKCCKCQAVLDEGSNPQTTRLGCLHVIHNSCLVSHIKSFPSQTAPAGYICPGCSTSVCYGFAENDISFGRIIFFLETNFVPSATYWVCFSHPSGSSELRWIAASDQLVADMASKKCQRFWITSSFKSERSNNAVRIYGFAITVNENLLESPEQTGLEKNLFGNHPVSFATENRDPPPAFASEPLMHPSAGKDAVPPATGFTRPASLDIVEIDGPSSATSSLPNHEPNFIKNSSPPGPGATTRKNALQVERQNSEVSYYADDEDANRKKYSRRGTIRHKFLRSLLPFWSSALPTLPVTAPPRKDASHADDASEGRARHHKSSKMDPRKILLIIAIMACMATMGILYYRIAQRGLGEDLPDDEVQ
ncbi:RING/U-box superfamily protein [Striga asiatica]|uniref:RING/U-box superfamily protein n=1 Tax=Striga asiatica TaxID=4170 RepID=A0A5A7QAD9_STRAF|nr:RING/U-box superfamily protein [Striga asiatica]